MRIDRVRQFKRDMEEVRFGREEKKGQNGEIR